MAKLKYTKDFLGPIIANSKSYYEVLRTLGLAYSGGNNSYIRKLVKNFGLDISHFTGSAHNKGKKRPILRPEIILVNDRLGGRREKAHLLRRMLIESGIPEQCALCSLKSEWNNKPLVLQVDHIDGNPLNNCKENLRFLCPNCHSQTENYGSKNQKETL